MDENLLERFEQEILSKVPHVKESKIVNATPLVDMSADLKECAREIYKIDIDNFKIYGKFDSKLLSGSIKARAAVHIIHNAILTGNLKSNQKVIEATSGNFGIALGQLSKLGVDVIALVSRKLQEGVFKELRDENIHVMDLDMEICPAPGMENKANEFATKATAENIRTQLMNFGFDSAIFDANRQKAEELLARQDIINFAIFLAEIYDLFCPAQYENQLNIEAHKTITAVEIDQQLHDNNDSLKDYQIICAFGTGGTSGGLSKYMSEKYDKKSVHVVFPPAGQDVAGIRTRNNAIGLKMYDPKIYAAEHDIDYDKAKFLLKFFVDKGHDIGESTALALYCGMMMIKSGTADKLVVIVADGIEKYKKNFEQISKPPMKISLDDAISKKYDKIIWVHTQYTPKEEGVEIIAKSLGVDKSSIIIPKASTINKLLSTQQIPDEFKVEGKSLLVCMAGNTSLMTAQVLAKNGIATQSLNGGITNLPESMGKNPGQYIQIARE